MASHSEAAMLSSRAMPCRVACKPHAQPGRIRSPRAKQGGWARGGVWAEAGAEGCVPAAAAPCAASPSAAVSDPAAQPARYG
eukprot:scaffold42688_cov61-Phaeocystis_antarctica.AAC.6